MANTLDDLLPEATKRMQALYGENKKIEDGSCDETLAVKCVNGTFVGKRQDGVLAFKGIPFVGAQPTGDLRWKAPVDVEPDDGVYEAYYFGKVPCQFRTAGQMGSLYPQGEDCLHLNVWRADDGSTEKKPVMVWIHGGAYELGSTAEPREEGCAFVSENPDVILVSIEYRLNILGFFYLSHLSDGADYPDSQNLGLMDQIAALKWVHENIAGFGGDPDCVTIFGQSAGGGSVSLLPLVEGSHRYFKRVIAQSGSPCLSRSVEQAIAATNKVLEALGCRCVADLMKVDVDELVKVASALLAMPGTTPTRDGRFLPEEAFEAYLSGAAADLDIMQGCTKDECNYFVFAMGPEGFIAWADGCKQTKLVQCTPEERELAEAYCASVEGDEYEHWSRFLDQYWFNAPLIRCAENQVLGGGKTFVYYFRVESSQPLLRSGHAVELSELFNHAEETLVTGREFDKVFSKTMRKMWVQFAKTGDPSLPAEVSPDGNAKVWPAYDLKDKWVMVFDEFDIHAAKEADVKIVDWDKTYFMTKYYVS